MVTTSPSGASRPASLADALIAFDAVELELARVRRDLYDAERRLGDRAAQCLALQDRLAALRAGAREVADRLTALVQVGTFGPGARVGVEALAAWLREIVEGVGRTRG